MSAEIPDIEELKKSELHEDGEQIDNQIKSTQQELFDLKREIVNYPAKEISDIKETWKTVVDGAKEKKDEDLLKDTEGTDQIHPDGSFDPENYYSDIIWSKERTKINLSPSIASLTNPDQIQTLLNDRSDITHYIAIWADRCEPCKRSAPQLNKFADAHKDDPTTTISYLETDRAPQVINLLKDTLHQPSLADTFPTVVAIKNGQISNAYSGEYEARKLESMKKGA